MSKGLDASFVHYGIRQADLSLLEALAQKHQLNFDWIQDEILKKYHEQKANDQELDPVTLVRLVEKALGRLEAY